METDEKPENVFKFKGCFTCLGNDCKILKKNEFHKDIYDIYDVLIYEDIELTPQEETEFKVCEKCMETLINIVKFQSQCIRSIKKLRDLPIEKLENKKEEEKKVYHNEWGDEITKEEWERDYGAYKREKKVYRDEWGKEITKEEWERDYAPYETEQKIYRDEWGKVITKEEWERDYGIYEKNNDDIEKTEEEPKEEKEDSLKENKPEVIQTPVIEEKTESDDKKTKTNPKKPKKEPKPVISLHCNVCGEFFRDLYSHSIKIHSMPTENKNQVKCHICDSILNKNDEHVTMAHFNSHYEYPEPRKCNACGEAIQNRREYREHVKSHLIKSEWEKTQYPCDFCDHIYQRISNLKYHINAIHPNNNRKFKAFLKY